jgi:Tfp pilus assembly protein PilF
MIDAGDHAGARKHLLESLRHDRRQPRVWGMLAAASLPASVTRGLRASLRTARRLARGSSPRA